MKKVTIRDIAERCGVTPTVVSAVLNGGGRRSRCSAEKKSLILETAKELEYCPNLFARSMVTQKVPVAALMLQLDPDNIICSSRYFAESAAKASTVLNKNGLELTLVLYRDEEEQLARFNELMKKGLIGGLISNVAPGKNSRFVKALLESKLPYVLQGETSIEAVSVMPAPDPLAGRFYLEAQKRYGAEKIYLHQMYGRTDVLFPYFADPDYNRFQYEPVTAVPEITKDPGNMIVSLGHEYYLRLNSRMKIASPLVYEREEFEFMIPQGVPRLISRGFLNCIEVAAEMLVQWLQHGEKPECKTHYIPEENKCVLKW